MPRARGSRRFEKQPLSSSALVDLLRSRGLAITDEAQAAQQISKIGYYRLSAYMVPFQRGRDNHDFKPGATFEGKRQECVYSPGVSCPSCPAFPGPESVFCGDAGAVGFGSQRLF